ncbi:MAG: transcription initiation factor IIB [Candidatus Altiarchaeales archaeon]|nr:MAG: transcription initiation factor IIB [Candidatus Altiarchaeales archaeon]RLI93936.1 MAG: transcription initiation factor IIB [Candidatus Altiarchaeales archaeon]RLI94111.1 MAG: transcription initiation factor IIB [Candidatus Altiarchaeales archaeon]HDO82389.1 transcription initiation factor IIB [Candidatus Altiarchaeales archaeon]HEX55038.1 transcription initiation factor IIB [Candidatus Altiarchaeales archaeon]
MFNEILENDLDLEDDEEIEELDLDDESSEYENKNKRCPECLSTNLRTDYSHGEIICKDCGFVIEDEMFDFGPEWRAFDEDQRVKRARTGGVLRYAKLNRGLTTEIDKYDRDIRGGAIQPERRAQLYRLRKLQRRSRMSDSMQRNLSIALPELDRMCACLNIPNTLKEECAIWYRKAVSNGLVRGRSIECVVAAIIYLVTRKHHLPKTLEELEEVSGIKRKDIGRSYRFICRRLKIKMPIATAMDYVPRFASELGLSGRTEAMAIEILKEASKKGVISGKGPTGVAAAAIYLASKLTNDRQTQKRIAEKLSGVTEITIRNRYEELVKALNIKL